MFSEASESSTSARRREPQREALSNSPAPVVLLRTSAKDPPPYGAQHHQDALWEGGNEALPPMWQRYMTPGGEKRYQDDTLRMVSRNRPLPGVRLDYPGGLVVTKCEWHISPLGRSYFVNHNTRTTSWKKPAPERPAGSLMPECVIEGHSECIWSLAYLGASCNVVSASEDDSIRQWKRGGEPVGKPLESDGGGITSMAVSPNETIVVCGSVDGRLRLWNIKKGSMIGDPWEGHDDAVRCLDWSPNALEIASGSDDGTIQRWNPDTGRRIAPPIKTSHGWVLAVKYSLQGDKFASGGTGAICIWSKDGKLLIEIKGHKDKVTSLCWSKDGAYIFSGSGDNTIRKWRAIDGKELVVFWGHALLIRSLCLSLNESYIVSASNDYSIRIWDLKTNQPVGDPLLHDDQVLTVTMSPDGKYIASAGIDKKIYVWSLEAALKVVGADDGNAKLKEHPARPRVVRQPIQATKIGSARYGNDFFGSESDRAAPPASPSSLTHRRRLLSSIHFSTPPANSSTDQQHIKYYDSNQGPPANKADQESSVTPTPPPGQVAPGSSLPNGIGAMFPTGALQDADDIRWAMSQPGTRLRTRTANGAHAQSSPNTKGKAPTRLRRDDRNVFGTDDGHRTATGATADSNTTSRDYTPSPEQTRALSHSPQDLTNELQGRSRFPVTSGGFGDIWKCELVKPDGAVQVAVKTIRAFESDNEVLMRKNNRRVRRELKVWGRLKHDCILPLWGVATDFGPYPAMICPWADNGALTGYLERQENLLSSHDKFSLLNDIALGLQYLHSKSIVHGDLTGSNVLISGNGRACLADFGLSTIILEFIGTSYFTSSIRGNVRWVAAELCEISEDNELSLSTECDIYSFGSITLQVLTCKVPYYNVKKDIAVLGQVIKGMKPEPPPESQIAPGHWEFIQRCWSSRASRSSIAEVVAFVACERQALSS